MREKFGVLLEGAGSGRLAADPQPGHDRRQRVAGRALLVLPRRLVVLPRRRQRQQYIELVPFFDSPVTCFAASSPPACCVVAVIGTTAFFLIRKQQRSDDVAEAARVATAFNKKVSAYRSSVESALTSSDSDDAQQDQGRVRRGRRQDAQARRGARVGQDALQDVPQGGEGREERSRKPYDDVSVVLDEAVVGQPFIKAAKSALKVEIDDYIGKGKYFYNGSVFRNKLVPGIAEESSRSSRRSRSPRGASRSRARCATR